MRHNKPKDSRWKNGEKRVKVGKILRSLCEWKKITILEAEVNPDYVHMLLKIPPEVRGFRLGGLLEWGKRRLYERFPELKFKCRNRAFWCRCHHIDTAGKNAVKMANHIGHRLDEDEFGEQLTMLGKM